MDLGVDAVLVGGEPGPNKLVVNEGGAVGLGQLAEQQEQDLQATDESSEEKEKGPSAR